LVKTFFLAVSDLAADHTADANAADAADSADAADLAANSDLAAAADHIAADAADAADHTADAADLADAAADHIAADAADSADAADTADSADSADHIADAAADSADLADLAADAADHIAANSFSLVGSNSHFFAISIASLGLLSSEYTFSNSYRHNSAEKMDRATLSFFCHFHALTIRISEYTSLSDSFLDLPLTSTSARISPWTYENASQIFLEQ
jgi:hypothetical protein